MLRKAPDISRYDLTCAGLPFTIAGMLRRAAAVLLFGLALAGWAVISPDSSGPASDTSAAAVPTSGFSKISGTIKGTYHLGFTGYVQNYDAVTTANLEWEEDPGYVVAPGCNCHAFFPTGTIDWSYRYEVKSESLDCTQTAIGQVEAGTGLQDKKEQMLVFWPVPGDDTQYYFSGRGAVNDSGTLTCDGGPSEVQPIEFLAVPPPEDIVIPTPTFSFPLAAPAGQVPMCDTTPFKIAKNATRIAGSCYGFNVDDGETQEYWRYDWDLQVRPEPIIFIHGFLGSEIKCGNEQAWPHLGVFDRPQLLKMALAPDGVSPAPGACSATVGEIVKRVIIDIYGSTVDFLNGLSPGSVYFFNWDWRKGPQESLAELSSFIADKRARHDDSKVVLMAHSYGGLLARLYLDGAGNAENVARVVTIGTPALGSPKALFPLYGGVEAPGGRGLNLFLDKQDLHEFAKNLAGDYFLYPSANYGPWLSLGGGAGVPQSEQGVLNYVASLGGTAALLSQALASHASVLDLPYIGTVNDPRFEVIVGLGVPTITSIQILGDGHVLLRYGNGDGTVPAKSAARGQPGSGNPNKAHTYYSCRVKHVPLPGHTQVTEAIDDFLKFGDDIDGLKNSNCPFNDFQMRVFRLPAVSSAGARAEGSGGPMSIDDAVMQDLVDYLDLPKEKIVVTNGDVPEIALPEGAYLEVTPISDEGSGTPVVYGPLNGQVTVSRSSGGVTVLVDGAPAPVLGDVNCDHQLTALDALLIVRAAGGVPLPPQNGCAEIGAGATPLGDIDCSQSITVADGLAGLQLIAGSPLALLSDCG